MSYKVDSINSSTFNILLKYSIQDYKAEKSLKNND